MTLSGTESGVEALSDRDLQHYESYTTRAWATLLPPTASLFFVFDLCDPLRWTLVGMAMDRLPSAAPAAQGEQASEPHHADGYIFTGLDSSVRTPEDAVHQFTTQ